MLSTPAGCVLAARCVHLAIVRGLYIAFTAVEKKDFLVNTLPRSSPMEMTRGND